MKIDAWILAPIAMGVFVKALRKFREAIEGKDKKDERTV